MHKLIHKFGIICGLLVFFFFAGYLLLAYFLQAESASMEQSSRALDINEQIQRLNSDFILIRLYDKTILSSQSNPVAQKEFGNLLAKEKVSIKQLLAESEDEAITALISDIQSLLNRYEITFNSLIQLRTEEQILHTQIQSIYKAISANLFRRNDIKLLRLLFNLSRFQDQYLTTHRESGLQAFALILRSLQNKLEQNDSFDQQIESYCSSYLEKVKKDLLQDRKRSSLNKYFDNISFQLTTNFNQSAALAKRQYSRETIRLSQLRSRLRFSLIVAIGIGIVGVVSILWLLAKRIVSPVQALAHVARSVRKGNMESRFQPSSSSRDEITQLGIDLNSMLDTLGQREHELLDHRNRLTEMVEERTLKLKQTNESLRQEVESRVEIEQELRLSSDNLLTEKERLAVTLYSIGDGVITTDIHGRIVLLNRVAEKLTGWNQKKADGKKLEEVFVIKGGQQTSSRLFREENKMYSVNKKLMLVARDGTEQQIETSNAVIRDQENKQIGTVLVFRDIGERVKMENELHKIRKLESVGVLAGGIAHDFNNILAGIMGNIELASFHVVEGSEVSTLLLEAKKATRRATKLTQQLLTFSKGGDPVKESISLMSIITESADFILHGSTVQCNYTFQDDLWMVTVDSGQIGQVIQNIVLNAMHAMPEGGKIDIRCNNVKGTEADPLLKKREVDYVRVTIQDTGCGISQETMDKVFDPYFTTKQEGSGLGLAICHSIINKHDGLIQVQSLPDSGTTFIIYLPVGTPADSVAAKQKKSKAAIKTARIMVMDDEEMIRSVTQAQLSALGHEVILVEDGEQALSKYQKLQEGGTPVDIVIMDLTIPGGMGGQKAAQRLLLLDPKATIIVASGYSNDPVMAHYRDYGFSAAAAKPFDLAELQHAIDSVLN